MGKQLGLLRQHPREYSSWCAMKQRCYNKKNPGYADYGGRGIRICQRWRKSFQAFLEDMGKRPLNRSIHRIDNDGNYEPGNCRWATALQQSKSKRHRKCIFFATLNGKTQSLIDWAKETGIKYPILHARIRELGWDDATALTAAPGTFRRKGKVSLTFRNETKTLREWGHQLNVPFEVLRQRYSLHKDDWSAERILTQPIGCTTKKNRLLELNGEKKTLQQWADHIGLKYGTLVIRLYKGWTLEEAVTIPLGGSRAR